MGFPLLLWLPSLNFPLKLSLNLPLLFLMNKSVVHWCHRVDLLGYLYPLKRGYVEIYRRGLLCAKRVGGQVWKWWKAKKCARFLYIQLTNVFYSFLVPTSRDRFSTRKIVQYQTCAVIGINVDVPGHQLLSAICINNSFLASRALFIETVGESRKSD